MDGEGEITYSQDLETTRACYKGNFKDGKMAGKGNLVWKDGDTYEGDFKNDLRNGFGVLTYSKQSVGDYYKGLWRDGKMSGKGKLVWKTGETFEGNFENGLKNGFGVLSYSKESSGDYYEGHWKDNKKSGKGKLVFKNGKTLEGFFENESFKHWTENQFENSLLLSYVFWVTFYPYLKNNDFK
jgi:hypothetical protein